MLYYTIYNSFPTFGVWGWISSHTNFLTAIYHGVFNFFDIQLNYEIFLPYWLWLLERRFFWLVAKNLFSWRHLVTSSVSDRHKLQRERVSFVSICFLDDTPFDFVAGFAVPYVPDVLWKYSVIRMFSVLEREFVVIVSCFEIVLCHFNSVSM